MRRIVARIGPNVTVVSVVAGESAHAYEVEGGPDHGLRFGSLLAVSEYVRSVTARGC